MPIVAKRNWDSAQEYLEYLRYLSAYVLFAERFVRNASVLEIGCGTGYGCDFLSNSASKIIALDVSKDNLTYLRRTYGKESILLVQADGMKLPFRTNSFDAVISFQVIEHIQPNIVVSFLSEINRVMKRNGRFLVSTPNSELRLLPFQKPFNPEHKKEYKANELQKLLTRIFDRVEIHGLYGSPEIQLDNWHLKYYKGGDI